MGYLMESYTKKSELWYYEILQHLKLKHFSMKPTTYVQLTEQLLNT